MKTTYEAAGWWKDAEEDIWDGGCQPGGTVATGDDLFRAGNLSELVLELVAFVGCTDRESVLIDCCDEPGRVDVQVMENGDGHPASERELEDWKAGTCRLWLCNYIFRVFKVTREAVTLAGAPGLEGFSSDSDQPHGPAPAVEGGTDGNE